MFTKLNDNLVCEREINLIDALCGVCFDITHLDKRNLLIKSNDVIQPNSKKIIRNEGMPKRDGSYGDLIINFKVKLPENLNDERKVYLKKLIKVKNNNNYDERKYQVCMCENYDELDDIELNSVNLDEENEEGAQIGCQTQ